MGAPKISLDQARDIAALREAGKSYAAIASLFGISEGAVHYHCLKQGAYTPKQVRMGAYGPMTFVAKDGRMQRRFTPAEDRRLEDLRRQGLNIPQIARQMGRAMTSVRIRLMTLALNQERLA